jgi:hypothetical protein
MDTDGVTPIVTVPMSNVEKQAVLNLSDFRELMDLEVSASWRYTSGQVFESGGDKLSIARLILDAKPKEAIQYRDRDAFNLRRPNLVVAVGNSKRRERDALNRDCVKEIVTIKPVFIDPPHMRQII